MQIPAAWLFYHSKQGHLLEVFILRRKEKRDIVSLSEGKGTTFENEEGIALGLDEGADTTIKLISTCYQRDYF
jgi:hypothetical protein